MYSKKRKLIRPHKHTNLKEKKTNQNNNPDNLISNSNSATTISMTTTTAGGVISGVGSGGLLLLGVPQQEKQPSRPTTPNFLTVPASPRPRLNTAEIKERMLKFCKRATVDYQVSTALVRF